MIRVVIISAAELFGRIRHQLHQALSAAAGSGLRIEGGFLLDDGPDQRLVNAVLLGSVGDHSVKVFAATRPGAGNAAGATGGTELLVRRDGVENAFKADLVAARTTSAGDAGFAGVGALDGIAAVNAGLDLVDAVK